MNITELLLNIKWGNFTKELNSLRENSKKSLDDLQKNQLIELKEIITYAIKNIEYYRSEEKYHINLDGINTIFELLNMLPIINKTLINKFKEDFIAQNYNGKVINMSTGGSTGKPLHYKMSFDDQRYSRLLKYRGYSYAGFNIGDNLLILGGGSLIKETNLKELIKSKLLNVKKIPSYGINDDDFRKIYNYINKESKTFIYGYASTIYLLANYIKSNNLIVNKNVVPGVFTTSELMTANQRTVIEQVFGNVVFDDYGVNDGGASAHECEEHAGLHLDMERSIIEVVDDYGISLAEGFGRVVVTSLKNKSMPFIRYETGDYAEITYEKCKCGRETPRLLRILGRTTDYLYFKGSYIGSPVLTVLMGKLDVDYYQIIQKNSDLVMFKVYRTEGFSKEMITHIENHIGVSMKSYFDDIRIEFEFSDKLPYIENKHKYIINEMFKQ